MGREWMREAAACWGRLRYHVMLLFFASDMTVISEPSGVAVRWDVAKGPVLQLFPCPGCQRHTELTTE
ncbi:hypothetical protein PBY51_010388 [Eleginops maclovinus]|uniref:Uncharacterized protein n=1 Tax=Eleginops maclovinus TaxID=56733 RepID=A0AAN7XA39_ELEMC|nr:hypothetical protein PBY51_010388 [Eleginops maclovinus]